MSADESSLPRSTCRHWLTPRQSAVFGKLPKKYVITGLTNAYSAVRYAISSHGACRSPKMRPSTYPLRCNTFIAVMQASELRNGGDPSDPQDWPREWTLLVEAQMGSRSVVVSEISSQGFLEMPDVQNHEMVQAVSSYGADQAFGVRILPGTTGCREYFFHMQ